MERFDAIWRRITAYEGELFHQKQGKPFRYSVVGAAISPSTTNRMLSRGQFAKAFARMPIAGPGELQDLQGPSYLYAILTDQRVGGNSE